MKNIYHKTPAIYDIIDLGSRSVPDVIYNMIYFILNVNPQINVAHNRDLKDFLYLMGHNHKYVIIVKVQKPLREK